MKARTFAISSLLLLATIEARAAEAVATFHSLGLTWSGSGGSATTVCTVRYRPKGAGAWSTGYPLWFDPRGIGGRPANEYRGSLVNLTPGTTYEIELALEGKTTTTSLTASTWSETFPVGTTTTAPPSSSSTLRITSSGTKDGYALYVASAGGSTIDVANKENNAVFIDASYVIVRGLTLKGAATNAIELGPNAHDVVIEENDISGWGKISTDGATTLWGETHGAVGCFNKKSVDRVIVQRNRMHHPRSDSNSWEEPRPSRGGNPHPLGPQAVIFETCGGNHVFRYNEVYSDDAHYFQDGFGGGDNFSYEGFPKNDSDIYGNAISHCWDDGIEAEGGNRNVRIWNNYIDRTYVKIALAGNSIGPSYVFRNVAGISRRSAATAPATVDGEDRGPFMKLGSNDAAFRNGRIFVFHNTTLQPSDPKYMLTLGVGYGLEDSGGPMTAVVTRNNILQLHKTNWDSIGDDGASATNDFDYDLYNGRITARAGQEGKGIKGVPKYLADGRTLDPSSPGFDVGQRLPGFNDGFKGAGPDMGAYENGGAPIEWGVDAGKGPVAPPDAGGAVDAGAPTIDDASAPPAPSDGGAPLPSDDASSGATQASESAAGCGCRTSGASSKDGMLLAIVLSLLTARSTSSRRRSARETCSSPSRHRCR